MENILEKLSELNLEVESKLSGKKLEDNLKKTGLAKYFSNNLNCNLLSKIHMDNCKHIKNRIINEEENKILTDILQINKSSLNETDNFALGSAFELLNDIISDKLENGSIFISSKASLLNTDHKYDYATLLTHVTLEKHSLKRILIIDWNLDSNLKIQKEFYNSSNVLYFSIHEYLNGRNSVETNFDYIGEKNGKGFNINVTLNNNSKYGNSEYMAIFYNILLPIAYEFNPELILVPTQFDISHETKVDQIYLEPQIYSHFFHSLSCLANGKILLLVDQSNLTNSFFDCVYYSVRSLMGFPCPQLKPLNEPNSDCIKSILNSISILRPYWYCLQLLQDHDESISLNEFIQNLKKFNTYSESANISQRNIINEIDDLNQIVEYFDFDARTCMCSDDTMMQHFHLTQVDHPEKPDRIKRIIETLKEKNLYQRCEQLKPRVGTDEELELCHKKNYIEKIKNLKNKTEEELIDLSKNPDSVYFNSATFECASLATGCLLEVVDKVCSKKYLNGYAVIRPPGHHAYSELCSGFCFFNSIAVAARYAQKNYEHVKKVLILDFDVHHGNGTQDIFLEDDSVLFISLHRFDNGCFYPTNSDSNYDNIGKAKGKGFNINIPWNLQTAGDAEYTAAFLRIVMPVAYQFNPDLVLVSAGFDAATGDPLGRYNISPSGFAQMTKMLSSLANGKIILGLEGGYNLTSISESMASCVSILLGDKCPSLPPINAKPKAYESIRNVISVLKNYWSCFKFEEKLPHCEFEKNFKSENKNKTKAVTVSEFNYTLRSRNKSNNDENKKEKTPLMKDIDTKRTKTKSSSSASVSSIILPALDENTVNELGDFSTAFSVIPLPYCPHLLEINKNIDKKLIDVNRPCSKCKSLKENWICLSCFEVGCSRFVHEHMASHYEETHHSMVLSYSDLSVWCYTCDSYVHNDLLTEVKELAYCSKFGENKK